MTVRILLYLVRTLLFQAKRVKILIIDQVLKRQNHLKPKLSVTPM